MTEASPPLSGYSALQALFEQIEATDNLELALIQRTLKKAEERDPELSDLLRACAIPHRFDATIVGVLREQPDDTTGNARLLDLVCGYSFVRRRQDRGYVYHDSTRDTLLTDWRSSEEKQAHFTQLNIRLADFYDQQYDEAAKDEDALGQLAGLMRSVNIERYRRLASTIETRLTTLLLEALYHQLLASTEEGLNYCESRFFKLETAGRLLTCQSLLGVARDFLQRLPDDQQVQNQFDRLNYFEVRVLRQMPSSDILQVEQMLCRLRERQTRGTQLYGWILNDLADILQSQLKLQEAIAIRQELLTLPEEADSYNFPLWAYNLGGLYAQIDELDLAREQYLAAIDRSLATKEARSDIRISAQLDAAGIYVVSGQWAQAFQNATEALVHARTKLTEDLGIQSAVDYRLMYLLSTYDPAASDAVADEYLTLVGKSSLAQLNALSCIRGALRDSGRIAAAEARIAQLSSNASESSYYQQFKPELEFVQAILHEDRGMFAEAVTMYTDLLEQTKNRLDLAWNRAAALSNRGMKLVAMGRWQEADADLRAAIKRWQDFGCLRTAADLQTNLADLLRCQGMLVEAQTLVDQARLVLLTGTSANTVNLYLVQGDLFRDQGRWAEAQTQYEQGVQDTAARRIPSSQARFLRRLAVVAAEQANWSAAATYDRQAAEISAQLAATDCYLPSQEEHDAQKQNIKGILALCDTAGRPRTLDNARDCLREASKVAPQNFWYQLNLAWVYAALEEWEDAARALTWALDLCPAPMRTPTLYGELRAYLLGIAAAWEPAGSDDPTLAFVIASLRQLDPQIAQADRIMLRIKLGDPLWRTGLYADAQQLYAMDDELYSALPTDAATAAALLARCGLAAFMNGDTIATRAHLAAALKTIPAADGDTGAALAAVLQPLLPDITRYWAFDDALLGWADDPATSTELRAQLTAFRKGLTSYLDTLMGLPSLELQVLVVTPIVFELSDALVPFVDSRQDGGKFLYELIPAMRDRIKAATGVRVPGVRARANSLLPPGVYEMQLDEVPVNRGQALLDHWYFAGQPELLDGLDVEGHCTPATHPVTGEPGCWLDAEGQAIAAAAGKATLSTPEFLVGHIESVLRRNMAHFLGVQEAANLLEEWAQLPGGKEQAAAALPTLFTRHRFTWLLKGLLAERVPVTDWQTILAATAELDASTVPVLALVRAVRLRLRSQLPGNTPTATRVALPVTYEEQLLGEEEGRAFLAADPVQKLALLAWLREEMERHDQETVLVTRSAALRPLLRRLVTPEFPDLMVQAEEELLSFDAPAAAVSDVTADVQHE